MTDEDCQYLDHRHLDVRSRPLALRQDVVTAHPRGPNHLLADADPGLDHSIDNATEDVAEEGGVLTMDTAAEDRLRLPTRLSQGLHGRSSDVAPSLSRAAGRPGPEDPAIDGILALYQVIDPDLGQDLGPSQGLDCGQDQCRDQRLDLGL